jgi:hypothetical protein
MTENRSKSAPQGLSETPTTWKKPVSGKAATTMSSRNADTSINNKLINNAEAANAETSIDNKLIKNAEAAIHMLQYTQVDIPAFLERMIERTEKDNNATHAVKATPTQPMTASDLKDINAKLNHLAKLQRAVAKAVFPNQPEVEESNEPGINIDVVTMDQKTVHSRKRCPSEELDPNSAKKRNTGGDDEQPPPSEKLDDNSANKPNTEGNDADHETPEWVKMDGCNILPLFSVMFSLFVCFIFLFISLFALVILSFDYSPSTLLTPFQGLLCPNSAIPYSSLSSTMPSKKTPP